MLAIHGFWSRRDRLSLWAEDADRPVKSPSQAVRSARRHPFAAPAATLPGVLAEALPEGLDLEGEPGEALLLLPSLLTAPLDSPDLVRARPRPAPTRMPALTSWSVPVLHLGPGPALELLGVLDEWAFDTDVRPGATLRYLARVADLARDLAERGRVLPTLTDLGDGEWAARWRAVVQGPDVAAVHSLVEGMPPVCRAEASSARDVRGREPDGLTDETVCAFVDAAVRARLAGAGASTSGGIPRRRKPRAGEEAREAWLAALGSVDGLFAPDTAQAEELAEQLAVWDEFGRGQAGPAHATFRLVEPVRPPTPAGLVVPADEPAADTATTEAPQSEVTQSEAPQSEAPQSEGSWRLEFWLQSAQDPSLLVAAEHVWGESGALGRWLERPDELLLAELGRASSIYPQIAGALRRARPAALELDAAGALEFLSQHAALLDQAGFGVLLPSWWTKRRRVALKGTATPSQEGGVTEGMFGRESLCTFDWRLAIGDEPLTDEELAALAATKEPLVRLRGEWVAVAPEQLQRGLEFIRRQAQEGAATSLARVVALAGTHPDDLDTPLPVDSIEGEGWLGALLDGTLDQALEPVEPPPGFTAQLRPYQSRGLAWLTFLTRLGLGACLADDMGLGKTVQLLALEAHLRAGPPGEGADAAPTLLLCPMSLVGTWEREAARFAPGLRVYAHHGPGRVRGKDLGAHLAGVDLVVTTYHTAHRDIEDLVAHTWARVVADEAQAIKNEHSRIARATKRLQAGCRYALTGTPVENKLVELWSIMDFLNPGMLGNSELFRTRYARPIERYGQTEPAARLRAVTRPYILRRLKTDKSIISDLPDKIEMKTYCNLTIEQASLYESVVGEMMERIEGSEGIERRGNVLAAMTKLKQVCNHPAQLLHDRSAIGRRSGKVNHLVEILDEIIQAGDKVLLFTQYTEFAEMLLPHLSAQFGREIIFLHGKTTKTRRDELVARFQSGAPGAPPIFLLSLKAGGTGLTLTAANHVIHLDRWWNPAVENQATDRAFRIGQTRNVQVRKFICAGTLEERIDDMIEQKKELADLVVGDGEGWLSELSTQELRRIFTLSPEAVGE